MRKKSKISRNSRKIYKKKRRKINRTFDFLYKLYYIILIRLIDYYSTYSQINISLLHNDIYKKDKK
jgi:hypothetical protein